MIKGAYLSNIMIQLEKKDIESIHKARISEVEKIDPKMERITCPLCADPKIIHLITAPNQGKLGQCPSCNVVYAYERPTVLVSNALYRYYVPSNLTNYEIRESQLESRPKELNEDLDCLECYTKRGTLLDIGASSGDFLVYARVRGWKVEATELSEMCADFMARTLNIQVMLGNILDIEFDKKYHAITLRHSVEHLREPIDELKALYDILEEEGILFITTPEHAKNLELVKEKHMLPLHLVNYTKDTLDLLLRKTGFKMISYESLKATDSNEITNMRAVAIKNE